MPLTLDAIKHLNLTKCIVLVKEPIIYYQPVVLYIYQTAQSTLQSIVHALHRFVCVTPTTLAH